MARIKYKEAVGQEAIRGKLPSGKKPTVLELKRLYIKESKSIREVAKELNLHPDTVHYWLKKYGIQTRNKSRKSQLVTIPLEEIERKVRELGIRGYARELGISEGTVRHHLRVRRDENNA
ncbi:hypothetical protein KA005_23615 [bacterium]|nr:hypothetical protein [bacterium]